MILTLTTIICDIAAQRKRKAAANEREVERADSAEWKRKAAMKEREAAGKRSDAAEQEREVAEQRRDAVLADVATIMRRLDEPKYRNGATAQRTRYAPLPPAPPA